ncbi:MAG: phosphopantothenoylcysteine decarboxylase [Limisphaerales bacterium]
MRIIITCGPAWTPVDRMRRITNASTGALGTVLHAGLQAAGHELLLYRGEMASAAPPEPAVIRPFSTNEDLAEQLQAVARREEVGAVLHAAALTDFDVWRVTDEAGRVLTDGKLPTRGGGVRLELQPALKLLPSLRGWFPNARIAGWKYEVDGGAEAARAAAERQLATGAADVCVLNGPAHGPGFTVHGPAGVLARLHDSGALAGWFGKWLGKA